MMSEDFVTYIAVSKFSIGLSGGNNEDHLVVERGDDIKYNGRQAIIAGRSVENVRLKSAIKAKWIVPEEELLDDDNYEYSAPSAKIKMRGATPQRDDVVSDGSIVTEEDTDMGSWQDVRKAAARPVNVEAQDRTEVQGVRFKNRADQGTVRTDVSKLSTTAIQSLELGSGIGSSKEQRLRSLEEKKMQRELEELRAQLQSQRAENVTLRQAHAADDLEDLNLGDDVEVLGQLATENPEDVEELLEEDKTMRLSLARQMVPDFDWDFSVNWKRKLKLLEDQSPLYVCAVYAVESDAMKKHIAKKYPEYIQN